ncbi:GNAT family N-acetyltransferase [Robiginitalea sp. IMCC43444]|uniref:GNAT family N-acetyltransferase n=1 Tax=Robiginitalea sp. IMCC43444 TaxID=3459121 RepID=UPI0040410BEF
MKPDSLHIRKIQAGDNPGMAQIIRGVFEEMNVPKTGTAYADASLDNMYDFFSVDKSAYWVITDGEEIWGGGGIAPLEGSDSNICELQKMYFRPELRGSGWGRKVLEKALHAARSMGYEHCYLETMPYMKSAQKLYSKFGFQYLQKPMGATGHTACQVWMQLKL